MKSDKIKKTGLSILGGIIVSTGLAYGLSSNESDFYRYLVLSGLGCAVVGYYLEQKHNEDSRIKELEGLLEQKKVDERVDTLEKMLQESDAVLAEQEEVIKNYEILLEEASVKFPCNCGQNMFDGIFKPEEEFVVECDYCKNKYAITLKIDSVLITEPIEDLNIDKLIKKNTEV